MSQFQERFKKWTKGHLVESILLSLIFSWFLVSALVYRVEVGVPNANITSYPKALWWGVVTFLTVGYGDFYPITTTGRILAAALMFAGVFSIAIVTSKISSYFLEQVLREGWGIMDTSSLKDHFIICGWKEEMSELLSHILDFNTQLTSSDIVLVANISQATLEGLRSTEKLKNIRVIIGNYYEAVNLQRAVPERAKKVLILADKTPAASGAIPSLTEVDSRTIITAMTLANIARGTLVAAEILDPKMDQYLKMASVSEVIYSREYSRLLLGNAAGGTGVANIIFDLLDPRTPTSISTMAIQEDLVGVPYSQFKGEFEKINVDNIVIGILENTGNQHQIKEQALRQAQKTPDVRKLVQNLKSVKELRCNHPVFNPPTDYVVPPGSMAIVVGTRAQRANKDSNTNAKAKPLEHAA